MKKLNVLVSYFCQSALVLFDGLDEVPSHSRDLVITTIEDFVDRYPHNRYIASCRTAAYRSQFRRFTDITIADFDDEQVEQFIYNWFSSQQDEKAETAKQFWQLLQEPEQASAKELARTPLLLTFLCLVYQRSQVIPATRSSLYGRALNILLEEWTTEKQVQRDEIYQGLHPDLEIELLAEIAYPNFKENRLFFHREDILKTISEFLADRLDAPKYLNAKAVLQAIEEQQGILLERDEGIYSFSHLTLQEYLTAYYIVTNQLEEEIVDEYLTDDRWREVFLLVAGLMRGRVSQLLQKMAERAKDYLETDKLQELVKWADSVTTNSVRNYKLVFKRVAAISLYLTLALTQKYLSGDLPQDLFEALYIGFPSEQFFVLSLREPPNQFVLYKSFLITRFMLENICQDLAIIPANSQDSAGILLQEEVKIITYKIKKMQVFNNIDFKPLKMNLEKRKRLTPEMSKECFEALGLPLKVAQLLRKEGEALEKYLKANLLILQCKEASVALSGKAWQPIEDNLLKLN